MVQLQLQVAALPLHLALELQDLRRRYAGSLAAAGQGVYSEESELQVLAKQLGRILAREARKGLAGRGLPMREISIAVDRLFPELREWTVQTALRIRLAAKEVAREAQAGRAALEALDAPTARAAV